MKYKEKPILCIGEEYVISALPHQENLIKWALENSDKQLEFQEKVKEYENGTEDLGMPV
jgi:hypothetical protein